MAPSNYINYHRLAHNYTKRPSRPRLRRTGYWPADARGHVWELERLIRRCRQAFQLVACIIH